MDTAVPSSPVSPRLSSSTETACTSADPPPETMPSSTAARVAEMASSMRCLRSLSSTSVCSADLDHADTAGQLGQALLELLAVPVGVGALDLLAELADAVGHLRRSRRRPRSTVVFSLVTMTLRAEPSTSRPTWSSLSPTSGATTWAPVRTARSSSIALRRSPNAGALTATPVNRPRILLTTSVDSASPSTSSATMISGLPAWTTFSSSGRRSETEEILPWWSRMYGSSRRPPCAPGRSPCTARCSPCRTACPR